MKKLFIKSLIALFYKGGSAGIKVLLILIITNKFGAEEYGAYTFAMSVFLFINSIFRFGFDVHLHKKIAEFFNGKNKYITQELFLRIASIPFFILLGISLLVVLLIPVVQSVNIWTSIKFDYLFELIIYSSIYSLMWLFAYYQRGLNKGNISILILEIVFPIINILLLLLFNEMYVEPRVILMHSFGISIFLSLILFAILDGVKWDKLNLVKFLPTVAFAKIEIREGFQFLLISISSMLMTWIDFFIISFFESESELGIFSVATRIAFFMLFPASAFAIYFSNKLVQFYSSGNFNEIRRYLLSVSIGLGIISLSLFSIINFFNAELLSFFGQEFKTATTVLLILTLGQLINSSTGAFETTILMSGEKKYLFKLNFIVVVVNLLFNIPLVYKFGINGAAIGTLIAIIFNRFVQYKIIYSKVLVPKTI